MKVALVHDWLNQMGGAEQVLEVLVSLYPHAPLLTSIYAPRQMPAHYQTWNIRTTWLDRLPGIHKHQQWYFMLYPFAFRHMRVEGCDVVLSNKSGFCHGIDAGGALHVCYCLAPTRYVWQYEEYMQAEAVPAPLVNLLKPLIAALRRWDYAAAQRVDAFVAISSEVQRRIRAFYNRDSVVIYPPVELDRYLPSGQPPGDYFLVVSRLIPYKRIDLAVEACTRLGLPLRVAGAGRDLERLRALAGPTVEFLGRVPDEDLPALMAGCRAFLFPGLEDFGIAPVEAQAAGRPVIAFRGGGALDTVIDGETGLFFDVQEVESLVEALRRFDDMHFSAERCAVNAQRFSRHTFERDLAAFVRARYDDHLMRAEERKLT